MGICYMLNIALKIKMGKVGFSICNTRIICYSYRRILKIGERFTLQYTKLNFRWLKS